MSTFAVLRHGRVLDASLPGTSRSGGALAQWVQTRHYAAPNPRQTSQKQPAKKVSSTYRPQKKEVKKLNFDSNFTKRAINPMAVNQLSNPLFDSDHRAELRLPILRPETLSVEAIGSAVAFPSSANSVLKAYGVPRNVLMDFRVLSKPCSVIRDATLKLVDLLDAASGGPSSNTRHVLTGSAGSGKSYLLLQSVQYCASSNWITLYIPRAITTVDSSSDYVYDVKTQTFMQLEYSYELLRRFLSVNEGALYEIPLQKTFSAETAVVPTGTLLPELINVALHDRSLAPAILAHVLDEVAQQTQFPVLMAVDDIQAVYRTSLYRDPHFNPVLSHHLSVPRLILEFASGKKSFARGAFLGALSTSNTRFRTPLELSEALGIPYPRPSGPYAYRSPELQEYARGLQNFVVPERMQVSEAASVFEVWMTDRALHSGEVRVGEDERRVPAPSDELFMTKFCEASGNPRSFVWTGLMGTLHAM